MRAINLKFPKSEIKLVGFPYGEEVYKNQAQDYISLDDKITIIFPDQIEKVASSFVQGFFANLVMTIGYKGIEGNVKIKTRNEALTASIRKNIY